MQKGMFFSGNLLIHAYVQSRNPLMLIIIKLFYYLLMIILGSLHVNITPIAANAKLDR